MLILLILNESFTFVSFFICRNRTYRMSIVALSADPNYRDSDLSEEVFITCWSPETRPMELVNTYRGRYCGQGDGCSGPPLCPEDISIGVQNLSEKTMVLEWRLPLIGCENYLSVSLLLFLCMCHLFMGALLIHLDLQLQFSKHFEITGEMLPLC